MKYKKQKEYIKIPLRTLMGNEYGTLKIKVCHRNFLLTTDESIGQVEILLKHFTFYESPKTRLNIYLF